MEAFALYRAEEVRPGLQEMDVTVKPGRLRPEWGPQGEWASECPADPARFALMVLLEVRTFG